MSSRFYVLPALIVAIGLGGRLEGQTSPRLGFFLGAQALRVRDGAAGRVQTLTNTLPAGDITVALDRLILEASYTQGTLTPETTAPTRDYVEGDVLAGVRIYKGLSIKGGPHARSYVLPGGTRRRLFWEGRGSFETPLSGHVAAAKL